MPSAMTESAISIWTPLIYQYSVGGLLFLISFILIFRAGACDLRRRVDRTWFVVAVAGMVAYFSVHVGIYLLAIFVDPAAPGGGG